MGAPEGGAGSWREDGASADPDRNRSPSQHPPPSIMPPEVPIRGEGVPPTPQGAGRFARDIAEDGEEPLEVAPDPATVAAAQAAMASRARAVARCLAGIAASIVVQIDLLRTGVDAQEGFAAGATLPGGVELDEEVEACVMDALDDLVLPAPPNSRGMFVALSP